MSAANNVCLTPSCIHTTSKILNSLDLSVEPCDDFYNFACGKFVKKTKIPENKVFVNPFSTISDKLQQQLRTIVSEPVNVSEPAPFRLAKELYTACMNKSLIKERDVEPMLKLHKLLGGWPVLEGDDWDEKSWTWEQSVKDFRKQGCSADYILSFLIEIDFKNTSRHIAYINQPKLKLPREYLVKGHDDPIVKAYYSYMVDMAVFYGADVLRAEEEMMDTLNFEMALANISLPEGKLHISTAFYNPMTLPELQKEYPYVDWLNYMNDILSEDIQIQSDEVIVVYVKSFFKDLGQILKDTPKRSMANYVMWRITEGFSYYLTEDLQKRQLKYKKDVSGRKDNLPRWKECLEVITNKLPKAVGGLFIRQYFREDAKKAAIEMVQNIRTAFKNILETVEWMDDKTREQAFKKLESIVLNIGYPDELMDDQQLEEYFAGLEINSYEYLESILRINMFNYNKYIVKLRKPVKRTDWPEESNAAEVDATYYLSRNSLELPAGILQAPFFAADSPKFMNYGAIGFIIGHAITKGFHDKNQQFDENGNLVDGWLPDTKSAYLEKARCIIDQYGNYTDKNVNLALNGINTVSNNIADHGGIKQAYRAYKRWVATHDDEPRLPGLDYSPDQLFWIAAAQIICTVYRPESLKKRITTDVHSPEQFRILGSFSNMEDFSKSFNCSVGSKMNPAKKCEMW